MALPDERESKAIRIKESWTRTNEWLLKQLHATPYLAELYRQIVRSNLPKHRARSIDIQDGLWQRYLIKYWFLDDAASAIVEDRYAKSMSMNSENTIMAIEINEFREDEPARSASIEKPTCPDAEMGNLSSTKKTRREKVGSGKMLRR